MTENPSDQQVNILDAVLLEECANCEREIAHHEKELSKLRTRLHAIRVLRGGGGSVARKGSRSGRKVWSPEEKQEASARMKKLWTERKNGADHGV